MTMTNYLEKYNYQTLCFTLSCTILVEHDASYLRVSPRMAEWRRNRGCVKKLTDAPTTSTQLRDIRVVTTCKYLKRIEKIKC